MARSETKRRTADRQRREGVELTWPAEHPELLPFLPLVYVAWSDGVLSPEELARIVDRVAHHDWLDDEARALLRSWLDAAAPPSATSLEALRTRIRRMDESSESVPGRSLLSLGIQLARMDGEHSSQWTGPHAGADLEELEAELGIVGREAVRDLVRAPEAAEEPPPDVRGAQAPAAFPTAALRAVLDEPHAELRREVMELLAQPEFRFSHDLPMDEYRARVVKALNAVAERGWGGLAYPANAAAGHDQSSALAVFETLAFGDHSVLVKFGVQFGLFGGSILQLGTSRHHKAHLPAVASLALPGCYAMTEIGHGSNVRDIETTATYDRLRDAFVIHTPVPRARKDWIGGAAKSARMASVFAQLEVEGERHGVHVFLVPLRDETGRPLHGVQIEDCGLKVGLNGVDNGRIGFDRVIVPRENLLDRFGTVDADGRYSSPIMGQGRRFFTMLATLVAGRISIGAASVSAAKTGLTIAIRYATRRRQFGPAGGAEVPLLHYLGHQRLLLPRLAHTYALHFALRRLVDDYARGARSDAPAGAGGEVEARAAALKVIASDACVRTLQACREACGGRGYAAENRFGRLRADTDVFTTFEGANAVLLQLVAKALLSEYREEMADVRLRDVVRLLAQRAQVGLIELNPVVTRRTDPEHLRDPDFHRAAFRYREERLVRSAALRLKAAIDDGSDTFEAMNTCQDHMMALGRAHAERLTVEAFQDAVAADDEEVARVLRPLCQLNALSLLERHRGWYLESGYLEPVKSRAIRAVVNDLCREIAPEASHLVDAFAIPDEVLEAPDGLAGE
jgi:acyl-CoA oxidase